jgi:hypothetical protein
LYTGLYPSSPAVAGFDAMSRGGSRCNAGENAASAASLPDSHFSFMLELNHEGGTSDSHLSVFSVFSEFGVFSVFVTRINTKWHEF